MGQKANLIHKYFSLKHKFDMLEGSERPCKEIPSDDDIKFMSKEFSVTDLKDKISAVESSLEYAYLRINTEKYWNNHADDQKMYENKLQTIVETRKNRVIDIENSIKEMIKNVLGPKWTCTCTFSYDSAFMEIGIENDDPKRQGCTFKFGHDFDLNLDRHYNYSNHEYDDDYELQMNYGCLGSFNLTGQNSDKVRIAFLNGMCQFTSDNDLINFIKDKLKFGCTEETKSQTEYKNIENILSNPLKYLNK